MRTKRTSTFVRSHMRRLPGGRKGRKRRSDMSSLGLLWILGALLLGLLGYKVVTSIPTYVYVLLLILVIVLIVIILFFVGVVVWRRREETPYHEVAQILRSPRQTPSRVQMKSPSASYNQAQLASRRSLGDLLIMSSAEFEEYIGDLLQRSGFTEVVRVGGAGDLCVDLRARDRQGKRVVVQCKRYQPGRNIGSKDIQTFIGMAFIHHKADRAMFVTTSAYKEEARRVANEHRENVLLMDGEDLIQWMGNITQ